MDCAQIKPFAIPPHGGIFDPVQAMHWRAGDRPWWRACFPQASRGWLEEFAPILGSGRILAVEPLRSWEIARLVRVTTEHGAWYLKCSPAPLDIEADVIERLMQLQPKRVPHRQLATERVPGS